MKEARIEGGERVPTRPFVTIKKFAQTLGVSIPTAKRLAKAVGIRRLAGSTYWLLNPDDTDDYLCGKLPATKEARP